MPARGSPVNSAPHRGAVCSLTSHIFKIAPSIEEDSFAYQTLFAAYIHCLFAIKDFEARQLFLHGCTKAYHASLFARMLLLGDQLIEEIMPLATLDGVCAKTQPVQLRNPLDCGHLLQRFDSSTFAGNYKAVSKCQP